MLLDDNDGALWAGVIEQAKDDVESLPYGSPDYTAAVAFLTSSARYWRNAREDVAEHLFIHGDDILRAGTRWVIKRRRAEGLPDHEPPPEPKAARLKPPRPEREPLVVPAILRAAFRRLPPDKNPFNPMYRAPTAGPGAR